MWDALVFIYLILVSGILIVGLTEWLEQPKNKDKMLVPTLWVSAPFLLIALGIYYTTT